MAGHHALILHEWTDFSVKLGGPGVEIIYASFQAIEDSNKRVDVTGRFNCYLYKKGFVWLSTHGLPDPACGRWKRLVVIYEGDNEYRTSSALWGASTAAMINLTVKAQALGVSQSLGSVLCHPLTDCLQIPALVMPVLALAAVAYRCYNKGFPLFEDGICVICLCHLERPAEVLSCGHAFHFNCIRSWLALGGCCPLCRKEPEDPALDALMHETTNALMMLGLFSHELSSWVPQLVQSLW